LSIYWIRRKKAKTVMAAIAATFVTRSFDSVLIMMAARARIAVTASVVCINGSVFTLKSILYSILCCSSQIARKFETNLRRFGLVTSYLTVISSN
jgi:hypothetical protein